MTDSEIVDLYWSRSEEAIARTQEKYEAYLTKTARSILSDPEDCEEVLNDTYLAAWNSMPQQRPSVLSTYLGRIARQIAIDRFRRQNSVKRRASEYALSLDELEDCVGGGSSPEQALDAKLLQEAINRFLRTLPEQEQAAFIGRYYFFDSLREVAAYCGMRESMLKSLLYRIRQRLKTYLEQEGFVP